MTSFPVFPDFYAHVMYELSISLLMDMDSEHRGLRRRFTSGRRQELEEHLCTDKDKAADREETRDTLRDQIMLQCVCVCVSEKNKPLQ